MKKSNQKSKNNSKERVNTFVNISEILNGQNGSNAQPFLKELNERQAVLQKLKQGEFCPTGILTHFVNLDKMINGLENSQLIILGSRPAMGKTALALNIAENVAFKDGLSVGIFSLEMTAEQLFYRMICSQSEVEIDKIRSGLLNVIEYQRVVAAVNSMMKKNVVIDDQPRLTIGEICERARSMKKEHGIEFLVIDYLQLIFGVCSDVSVTDDAIQYRDLNLHAEGSIIMRELKVLSRELEIPILCLSQLSRKVEERAGHRPMISDLRDCGAIEDHADVIMFLLRREYYDPYDKPGMAELIVSKNRHGVVGNVNMTFRKELAQFTNYTSPQAYQASNQNNEAFNAFSP